MLMALDIISMDYIDPDETFTAHERLLRIIRIKYQV